MAIWHWLGVHPCNDRGTLGGLSALHPSREAIARTLLRVGFIRDHDSEFKKSDMPKAMRVGRGVPVKRIPSLVHDVIKKGYACLEERQVREGDRKVTRKFV